MTRWRTTSRGPRGTVDARIDTRWSGQPRRMLRVSRVSVLLVAAAILGLVAGVLWGSTERLADRRAPVDRDPAVLTEQQ